MPLKTVVVTAARRTSDQYSSSNQSSLTCRLGVVIGRRVERDKFRRVEFSGVAWHTDAGLEETIWRVVTWLERYAPAWSAALEVHDVVVIACHHAVPEC